MMKTLTTIKHNMRVIIDAVDADPELTESLEVLGFTPGTEATIISKAPFSGPLSIELRGSRVALRYEDASHILVR